MKEYFKYFLFAFYFLTNGLFIFKYGFRIMGYYSAFFVIIYILLFSIVLFFFRKFELNSRFYKLGFYAIVFSFFILTIIINNVVDGNILNTDRWSAMDVGIKALLNNEYPYDKLDHLNGRTSNLPFLFIIGLPFKLIGDVGYLQSATFLIMAFTIYKISKKFKGSLFGLILLVGCFSYYWEIYAKSDLMSNFIIIACVLVLFYDRKSKNKEPFFYGSLSAFLLLTRLISTIPLILFNGKTFFTNSLNYQIKFLLGGIITAFALFFWVFHSVESWEYFLQYNPFELQSRQLPFLLSLFFVMVPFLFIYKIENRRTFLSYGAVLVAFPIFCSFLLKVSTGNFLENILSSSYDISYLNIPLPFIILFLIEDYNKKFNSEK